MKECKNYTATQYFPDQKMGQMVNGWRNENLEYQMFRPKLFDIVISLDVTEHVFSPELMFKEIYRTLKPGGLYISTFPIENDLLDPAVKLARLRTGDKIDFIETPPKYHGNPISSEGALVTYRYGYKIHELISEWAPFAVEIVRFADKHCGILGEYTEVIVCRKMQACLKKTRSSVLHRLKLQFPNERD